MHISSTDVVSLISLSTIFWLVMIFIALVLGLFLGSAGKLNRDYDADSEKIVRDLSRQKLREQRSEPELVLVAPRELRVVKKV